MPTKKIRDLDPQEVCRHPEHKAPQHVVYSDGVYEHTCPSCGASYTFIVRNQHYYWSKWGVKTTPWFRELQNSLEK